MFPGVHPNFSKKSYGDFFCFLFGFLPRIFPPLSWKTQNLPKILQLFLQKLDKEFFLETMSELLEKFLTPLYHYCFSRIGWILPKHFPRIHFKPCLAFFPEFFQDFLSESLDFYRDYFPNSTRDFHPIPFKDVFESSFKGSLRVLFQRFFRDFVIHLRILPLHFEGISSANLSWLMRSYLNSSS